jgi:ribose transport system ATP-binding protein
MNPTRFDPLLEVRSLSMSFAGVRALDRANLQLASGEVHALLGHNGSGKSTLVKILAGRYRPDQGSQVAINGSLMKWQDPGESERLGVRVVHQNLALIPSLTVAENVAMGAGYSVQGLHRLRWRRENDLVRRQMRELGYDIPGHTLVQALPASAQTAVAISRALMPREDRPRPTIVILDEVTATMPHTEITRMFELVRALRSQGVGILYVSHHLEEVLDIADRVTVLREGAVVLNSDSVGLSVDQLADVVVGTVDWRSRSGRMSVSPDSGGETSAELRRLQVESLTGQIITDLSFIADPGRITGFAGITGSGREEVANLLVADANRSGTVRLGGDVLPAGRADLAGKRGMVLLPADRLAYGLFPNLSIRENMTITKLLAGRRLMPIRASRERSEAKEWIDTLRIHGAKPDGDIIRLSGGNQQKAVLVRCLWTKPKALILDEPTQGVDIGAVAEIHGLIREVSKFTVVIVCSSDNYELATLCDEVIVLSRGKVIERLQGETISESALDRIELTG